MLRKIWNTLRYGDSKTKTFLISVMVLILAMFGCFAALLVTQSFLPGLLAAVCAIFVIALAKDAVLVVKQNDASGKAATAKKANAGNGQFGLGDGWELPETAEEEKGKKKKKKKSAEQEAKEQEEREKEDEEEFGDNALASMTTDKLKRLLVRYKVKQEHVPVVIDLCVSERVRQAPGFAWVEDGMLKILVIERKARLITRPLSRLQVMEVERGIAVKASNEYVELRDSDVMKKAFSPYLPRYQKKEIGGRTVLLKNLYVLDEDINFTSASVNELKKLFSFRIEIEERRLQDTGQSPYFKKLFVDSFLWRDGILSLQEYKTEVENVIESLADLSVPYGEFETTLSVMISSGLLPVEYRNYALAKRTENESNASQPKGKRKGKRK